MLDYNVAYFIHKAKTKEQLLKARKLLEDGIEYINQKLLNM